MLYARICSLMAKYKIVVWYDEYRVFSSIFHELTIEDAHNLEFEGSFLKIRWRIETDDPKLEKKWLIYVPRSRKESDWLRELGLIGVTFEPDFSDILERI